MKIPLVEQIACVKREIAMRRAVYPRQIAQGRLSQDAADRELARMQAVLVTLEFVTELVNAIIERTEQ